MTKIVIYTTNGLQFTADIHNCPDMLELKTGIILNGGFIGPRLWIPAHFILAITMETPLGTCQ